MSDTMTHALTSSNISHMPGMAPRYEVVEFGNPNSCAEWLNKHPDYELISLTPISTTNHFSKEQESTVWMVARLIS